jgi:hypothetical protein
VVTNSFLRTWALDFIPCTHRPSFFQPTKSTGSAASADVTSDGADNCIPDDRGWRTVVVAPKSGSKLRVEYSFEVQGHWAVETVLTRLHSQREKGAYVKANPRYLLYRGTGDVIPLNTLISGVGYKVFYDWSPDYKEPKNQSIEV